jgi:hypothetical protein
MVGSHQLFGVEETFKQNREEGKKMLKHSIDGRTLRLAGLALATAMLTVFGSVPAGANDKVVSRKELKNLIAHAETKADHERIAQYFDAEAAKYEEQAKQHADLAQSYKQTDPGSTKYPGSMQTFDHCDDLSKSLQKAAKDARELAAEHREMAKAAK